MDNIHKLYDMEQRITNLEVGLHAMWMLLQRDLPDSFAKDDINRMLKEHFDAALKLGGCRRVHMDTDG